MLHGMTSGSALSLAALVLLVVSGEPALAKEKDTRDKDAARQSCIGAFGDRDHFDWVPRMGIENALSECQVAIGGFPEDPDVQLYYAIARDQFADLGGTQQDNLYATEVYRRLAAEGVPLAEYALGTMFDEESGVSTEDGLSYMTRARDGEFGVSIGCEALQIFGYSDFDGSGAYYDVAAAESLARGNYVCAAALATMYWSGHATAEQLSLSIADHARYGAVHGDPNSMAMVGLFYAHGTGSTDIDEQLRGQYTARQDAERAGYWLLLAHWGSKSSMRPQTHQDFWRYGHLLSPAVVRSMQTALTALGLYSGPIEGTFGDTTRMALEAFEASDMDAVFQMVRAKEKYDSALGQREPLHIGDAAMAVTD